MQRIRKSLIWLMAALLVCSFLPPGPAQRASAAADYFMPDDLKLRSTKSLALEGANMISRSNVYTTTSPTLKITGTFHSVIDSSLSVEVQQLIFQNNKYVPVDSRIAIGTVQREGSTNRFTTSNLTLFPGFNRITFRGMEGNFERSEIFYVLYDQVPYIQNLVVYGSGSTPIQLNEGTNAVVDTKIVALQGQVQNATVVGVSLNGGPETNATVLENGTFVLPSLSLKGGRNELTIRVANNSDSIQVKRVIYFEDTIENDPFVKVDMTFAGATYDNVHETIPIVSNGTKGAPSDVYLRVEILLPIDAVDNANYLRKIKYSFGNGTNWTNVANWPNVGFTDPDDPELDTLKLTGAGGVNRQILTFTTAAHSFTDTTAEGLKELVVAVTDGTNNWSKRIRFNYQPGATVIKNIYLLPDFNESSNHNVTTQTQLPLNGQELSSPNFYILVEKDGPAGQLKAEYLPSGSLQTTPIAATGLTSDQEVYLVKGFPNGQHQAQFYYGTNRDAAYRVSLAYVAKQFIDLNLRDGQTFEFNSRDQNNVLLITGSYVGFEGLTNWQYVVNSNALDPKDSKYDGYDVDLDINPSTGDYAFELRLPIRADGPIYFGQNTLLFTGTEEVNGQKREVRKELRIYVIDTNVSTIARFHPVAVPSGARTTLPPYDLNNGFDENLLDQVFEISPAFAVNNDRYLTSETQYDLVFRGHGANYVNLKRGSETILYLDNTVIGVNPEYKDGETYAPTGIVYDFSGNEDDFVVRVRGLKFDEPGTHVYNLELINSSGARTTQRIEIERELAAFRIFAPQPTVGDQIVVNKNFVRIDIEAEGATAVRVDGQEATKRTDFPNRFIYDYTDLKPNKWNDIKIEIERAGTKINETIRVYYTGEVKIDAQYMEPLKAKHSVFNKKLELSFPRGTVLMSAIQNANGVYKYYTDNKLLFGIANPQDGVVARRDDYGQDIKTIYPITNAMIALFNEVNLGNFTRISDVYWISGGLGESSSGPKRDGLPPYSEEGSFIPGGSASGYHDPERKIVPSQRGTLKLTFDENVVDDAAHTVTVFRFANGYWENIGGAVDTKNNTISVPFDEFGYYVVMKLRRSYSDIANHPWARNVLNGLYSKGIMNNLRYDEFGADDLTTRGEFVTLLVKGLNLPLNYDDNNTFTDIQPGTKTSTWTYEHIETAARAGIVQGKAVGYFGSEIPITREEAAVMIARALELKMAANDKKLEDSLNKTFLDGSKINTYARPAVDAVYKAKIMTGSEVTIPGSDKKGLNFNPTSNMTRAEAGAIAVRMFQRSTNLFPKTLA